MAADKDDADQPLSGGAKPIGPGDPAIDDRVPSKGEGAKQELDQEEQRIKAVEEEQSADA